MIKLKTDYPLALNSPDYHYSLNHSEGGPCSDNSKNKFFNKKLYELNLTPKLYILDYGCAGGGFIEDCVNDGYIGIGLEGTDYNFKKRKNAWNTIPNNLFTCDVTKPFTLYDESLENIVLFDIITAWEFMEHIALPDLYNVCNNTKKHLKTSGYWIMSISEEPGLPYHQTTKDKQWWLNFFARQDFKNNPSLIKYFDNNWIRKDTNSFHLILSKIIN